MELNTKDISRLLMINEKKVQQLVKKNEIPFQFLHDKVVFNKQHIIEWALSRNLPINLSGDTKFGEYHLETISTLLEPDSFHYSCDFIEPSYIEQMVSLIQFDESVDREIIVRLLKSRESMMSTAIGNGISLPHPRIPLMVGRQKPVINFFFPSRPLNLNSVDGQPVHTLILIISQTIKQHLSLIAHLSFLLSQNEFRTALEQRSSSQSIIESIRRIEESRNLANSDG